MSPVIAFPASARQHRPRVKLLFPLPGALGWIKTRTRQIMQHYHAVPRRDAIALACWDWDMCFCRVKKTQAQRLQEAA
jgi:hypothetical protein